MQDGLAQQYGHQQAEPAVPHPCERDTEWSAHRQREKEHHPVRGMMPGGHMSQGRSAHRDQGNP
ncbi:hypothetical protein GCM10010467_19680 [Actinocorallia glomerata]|uniref:Uncharacterized protein n=1 Tax=Actinocorallia glomerata TaxID=46203 RepID=A0ABP6PN53_9ACTN